MSSYDWPIRHSEDAICKFRENYLLLTWCYTKRCRFGKSVAACYQWWPRGNWLLSRSQRINRVSRWSPAWTDPDQGSYLGIRCMPDEGHSSSAVEIHWACSPVEELELVNGKYIMGAVVCGTNGTFEVAHSAVVIWGASGNGRILVTIGVPSNWAEQATVLHERRNFLQVTIFRWGITLNFKTTNSFQAVCIMCFDKTLRYQETDCDVQWMVLLSVQP